MAMTRVAALFVTSLLSALLAAQDTSAVRQDTSPRRSDYGTQGTGGKVKAPTLIRRIDPTYTPEARQARLAGTVLLRIIVDKYGIPTRVDVKRGLFTDSGDDPGLNDKAVEAVKQWRFSPGTKDGKPVAVLAIVEVEFRLI